MSDTEETQNEDKTVEFATDCIHRFMIEDCNVRGQWVTLDESWQTLCSRAEYPSVVKQVLGESLAAVAMLGATIKYDGMLIFQISGGSPLEMLVIQATSDGQLRGMARWQDGAELDGDFRQLFGDEARLVISVEPTGKGDRYQSIVSLEGDSLSDCLASYFEQSEQLETKLYLAVDDECATGMLVQKLPGEAEDSDGWNRVQALADTVTTDELLSLSAEKLLHRLFHEEKLELYAPELLRFECSCSAEKVHNMLLGLGQDEAESIIAEHGSIDVGCEFCNAQYSLDKIDLAQLFAAGAVTSGHSVH